jgi:cbb3-type cytochrome oxidase maturation protein
MSVLYVLIPLALMLLAVAAWALIWAIRSGQFDDLESHGWSVVLDDDQKPPPETDAATGAGGRPAADRKPDTTPGVEPERRSNDLNAAEDGGGGKS